jgi:hypothetical protein
MADDAPDKEAKDEAKLFNLGLPDSAGHKGTITIDENAPVEGVILAFDAVGKLADYIAARVMEVNKAKAPIVFHNPADFVALGELRAFNSLAEVFCKMLADLLARAEKLREKSPFDASMGQLEFLSLTAAGAVGAIGSLISSGLQILSLFRADHTFKNYKVEVEDQVLAITVAGRLASSIPVFSSGVVPVKPAAESPALKTLKGLKDQRMKLQAALALLGEDEDEEPVAPGATSEPKKPPKPAPIVKLIAEINQALKDFDTFVQSLSKVDDKTGASRLSQIIIGETLDALLDKGALILWLKAVAAGGGTHARITTFTDELTYSGGAIASYAIFNGSGALKEANTVPMYGGKISISKLCDGKTGVFNPEPLPSDPEELAARYAADYPP